MFLFESHTHTHKYIFQLVLEAGSVDLHKKEQRGSHCKINSCLNLLMEKLRLKKIIGSLFKFLIIQTTVSSHGLTLPCNGERPDSVGSQKLPLLRNCIAKSSIQRTRKWKQRWSLVLEHIRLGGFGLTKPPLGFPGA